MKKRKCSIYVGRFFEQKLMLRSSLKRDQIYNCQKYDLGHTFVLFKSDFEQNHTYEVWELRHRHP